MESTAFQRGGLQLLFVLLCVSICGGGAFAPTTTSSATTTSFAHSTTLPQKPAFLVGNEAASKLPSGAAAQPARSALFMGLLEDWVTKTDEETLTKSNEKYLADISKRVDAINALEPAIEDLGDDELAAKTVEFKSRLAKGDETLDDILEEAFAVVREAAWRVLEQRHYDVQLLGGMILHDGRLAEMATGEGKTLVSTLPCYLNALSGQTSFVVTVNDYLARRDMEKMGQVHRYLGLTVGLIQSGMTEEERKRAYGCDVVYVTNSELGFDYLRDHLSYTPEGTVLPTANSGSGEFDGFCVVDEADSVLIDEARTPLIISKQVPAPSQKFKVANQLAGALKKDVHYEVDEKNKNVILNKRGYRDSEKALGVDSLFSLQADGQAWAPYVSNAVKAKELFTRDVEYAILKDDKTGEQNGIGIIDSFTGRVLDGRRWSDGLHQSIEAKEDIDVSQKSQVIAKVTYQALFRQFSRLSGMTGTALSDAAEFELVYGLRVTAVPTALPVSRRDYPDVSYKTRKAANDAIVKEVVSVGGGEPDGRPCLIGTTSVASSEIIQAALRERGVEAELLNASPKNAPRESELVAQAGRAGVVTVATNMAGRGTDILLGGCPATMARIKARSVLIDEKGVLTPEEAKLAPPSPDEGYYPCEISEDATFLLADAAASIKKHFGDDLSFIDFDELLTVATDATEGDDDPEHVVKLRDAVEAIKETYKPVLAEEKETVKKLGGLYVMGSNRHESSRIDNQLRGRAGRQGDPGTSRFFLSFEDDMFVVFGGDGLRNILKTFRVSDDMPVEAPQVTKALDTVQRTVEEKYREIRGEVLKFDEVLNAQRRVIYSRRRDVLFGSNEHTLELLEKYHMESVKDIVKAQSSEDGKTVNVEKVLEKVSQFFPSVGGVVTREDLAGMDQQGVTDFLDVAVEEVLKTKVEEADERATASGKSPMALARSAKYLMLVTMDNAWSDHLQNMEDIKEGVILRKYQGLDPVAEYMNDALTLFEGLEDKMRLNAVFSLWQSLAVPAAQTEPQSA